LNQPVYRTLFDTVDLDLVLERRRGESFFAEEGFSFAPGTKDGVSDVTALRFAQTWVRQERNMAFALRSSFSLGLDMLGSTINPNGIPDSQFLTWQGQGEAVFLPFARESLLPVALLGEQQIVVRAGAQLTADSLLPSEQYAVGGVNTVRGYRQNEIVRDIGWFIQLEYRVPIAYLPVQALGAGIDDGRIDMFPFFDAGGGFNNTVDAIDQDGNEVIITKDEENIASVGLGIRWEPSPALEMALSVGVPFTQGYPDEQDDLQDYGINFLLRFELWPWPLRTRSSMNG
jgi:hemolysin activation/secretion protein